MKLLALLINAAMAVTPVAIAAQNSDAPPAVITPTATVAPAATEAAAAAAIAAATPAPECELHVFPTLEGQAMTTTMLSGFGVLGAIADSAANKDRNVSEAAYLKEALGPRLQVEALKKIDVVTALRLPPSQVIFETPISDREITTKAATRLSNSTASCYAELVVTQSLYRKAAMYGRSLNNRFVFKDFRMGKTSAKLVKGRGGNGLSHFPPKSTDETEAAEQDLRTAFAANFTEFAKTLSTPN